MLARSLCQKEVGIKLEGDLAFAIKKDECQPSFRTRALVKELCQYALFAVSGSSTSDEYDLIKKRALDMKTKGITPIVVAMYPREDGDISRRLADAVGGRYAEGLSARELISLLCDAECCVSARLHLLIFAKIANTPFEGVGNDPKIRAFCGESE
jgi:hypothetical protein